VTRLTVVPLRSRPSQGNDENLGPLSTPRLVWNSNPARVKTLSGGVCSKALTSAGTQVRDPDDVWGATATNPAVETLTRTDYGLESRPNSSDMVSQQANLPSYCLGSIRFLLDQGRYLALFFRIGQIGRNVGKSFGMGFSHRCLNV